MSATAECPLIGIEAQRVFLDLRDRTAAFDLAEEVLPLTYDLHFGRGAGELMGKGLARLRECTTLEEVDAVFAQSRDAWDAAGHGANLTTDKEGAWRRIQTVSGLDTATGHVVDVGNPNNGFGDCLLRRNPGVRLVTGVDHRKDPAVMLGERLHFAHQEDRARIPLADGSADIVAFRVALHHMTKQIQEALLAEAARVLRPDGEILILEDSWADTPGFTDNSLTIKFRALDEADKLAALSLFDVSGCLTKHETVAYPLSYRSAADWENLLTGVGASSIDTAYWGFSVFTVYAAPLAVIRAKIA
ncbi:class I SAM-dependent methyltransferase [Streptomyces sp. NBC_01808]|uniref:class I SAM-dependent methyltransferase n=1 Tax=Streptomyces sp. NBC_01808 TaxID=2975947 RepID=UPI002DDA4483|nr:class I SAM-dependent methyltransferase [Streptomyces sp. NBC_01808]WSA40329.1 class I SAM-dependent methyltransferase [Streptomyces sp. NBC_01808]